MTAVNLMGAMTEDSGRGRKRNTVYKPSATYPQGREGGRGRDEGAGAPLPPSLPLFFLPLLCLSLYDCRLSTCLLFHLLLLSLARAHNLFLQSHYLSVFPYDRIFNYATVLPLYIFSLAPSLVSLWQSVVGQEH